VIGEIYKKKLKDGMGAEHVEQIRSRDFIIKVKYEEIMKIEEMEGKSAYTLISFSPLPVEIQ
jgi:hypothetical protein